MMGSTCQSSKKASVFGLKRERIQLAYQRLESSTTLKMQRQLKLQDTILALGWRGGVNQSATNFGADHSERSTPSSLLEILSG